MQKVLLYYFADLCSVFVNVFILTDKDNRAGKYIYLCVYICMYIHIFIYGACNIIYLCTSKDNVLSLRCVRACACACRPFSEPFCWGGDDIGFLVLAKALIIGSDPGLWFLGLKHGEWIRLHSIHERQEHNFLIQRSTDECALLRVWSDAREEHLRL